jgi:hypothetical protein
MQHPTTPTPLNPEDGCNSLPHTQGLYSNIIMYKPTYEKNFNVLKSRSNIRLYFELAKFSFANCERVYEYCTFGYFLGTGIAEMWSGFLGLQFN